MHTVNRVTILLLHASLILLLSSCHAFRLLGWGPPSDKDTNHFVTSTLNPSDSTFRFTKSEKEFHLPDSIQLKKHKISTEDFIKKSKTRALVIIRNDTIVFERYYSDYTPSTVAPIYSITKTFIGALVGIAHKEGYIHSVQDSLGKYLPNLRDKRLHSVTIEQLLNMRSGIRFSNDFWNPFGRFSQLHYGRNFRKYILERPRARFKAGEKYTYNQIDVQLLGQIISNSTGRTVTAYMEEKIWRPLGMQHPAYWNLDSKKHSMENCGSGLHVNPTDLAKLARLYLNNGIWDEKEILAKDWVDRSVKIDSATKNFYVTYLWKHTLKQAHSSDQTTARTEETQVTSSHKAPYVRENDFFSVGMGSKRILYVCPEKNMIVVKFSKGYRYQNARNIIHNLTNQMEPLPETGGL